MPGLWFCGEIGRIGRQVTYHCPHAGDFLARRVNAHLKGLVAYQVLQRMLFVAVEAVLLPFALQHATVRAKLARPYSYGAFHIPP
jgi:hypothetical protein